MSSYSSEQKLKLISSIREIHRNNQSDMKYREAVLNGEEDTNFFKFDQQKTDDVNIKNTHQTFPLRCLFAILIFLIYLWCDFNQLSFHGLTSKDIYSRIEKNYSINVFDFIESFPYTKNGL